MEISSNVLNKVIDMMKNFELIVVRSTGTYLDFCLTDKEVTTFSLIRILKKTKMKQFIDGIDYDYFSLLSSLDGDIKLKFGDKVVASNGKNELEFPLNDEEDDMIEIINSYLGLIEFETFDELINNVIEMRSQNDDDINIIEKFEPDNNELSKIIKFSSKIKQDYIHIIGDGKKLFFKSFNDKAKSKNEISKTKNTFDKMFKKLHLKITQSVKECSFALFDTEDSPLIVFNSDEDLRICMFITAMDEDED